MADRAELNRQIAEILQGWPEEGEAPGGGLSEGSGWPEGSGRPAEADVSGESGRPEKASLAARLEQSLEAFLVAQKYGDVPRAASHVGAVLSLPLDDLRKAALLSLMVRLTGKRKFDPIAQYILQNQEVFVTSQG